MWVLTKVPINESGHHQTLGAAMNEPDGLFPVARRTVSVARL